MTNTCPCCGAEMDFTEVDKLLFIHLPKNQRAILDVLIEKHPRPVLMSTFVTRAYPNPDDEPESAERVMGVTLVYLRKKLEQYGWFIPKNKGAPGKPGLYQLVRN